ncbi:MAG: class I SAM-dependent methyltransferase, partial [Candidatus Levyibacteriota bacterium]
VTVQKLMDFARWYNYATQILPLSERNLSIPSVFNDSIIRGIMLFMTTDQRHHWNNLHQEDKAKLEEPTTFAKEVQQILHTKVKILELGCGSGKDAIFFAEQGNTVVASDFSDVLIAKNKKEYPLSELTFQTIDISKKMPFQNNEFDIIYSRLSLHYFADKTTKNIFKELHRILKPSGFLCFICKSIKDPLYGKGKKVEEDMFEDNGHIRHFFSEEYAKECLTGLFKITKLESGEEQFYNRPSTFVKVIAQKK